MHIAANVSSVPPYDRQPPPQAWGSHRPSRAALALLAFATLISFTATGCNPGRSSSSIAGSPFASDADASSPSRPVPRTPLMRILGSSREGRPIMGYWFNSTQAGHTVLLFAGIHGDEPTTVTVARRLVDRLTADSAAFGDAAVVVIPLANPDGFERRTRQNANKVDLNRNFPAANWSGAASRPASKYWSGPAPLSEPESRLLHDLVVKLKPSRILTIHSIRRPRHGNNYDGPAKKLAELMASHNGYAVLPTIGYPTPGSFGSWAGVDRKIPTITLELPSDTPGDVAWRENGEALLAFIRGR